MRLVEDLLGRHPDDQPYLIAGPVAVTHGSLRKEVAHEAALFASAGIGPGTAVALQMPPSFTKVEVLLALWRLGAQVMLIDHRLKPTEVDALHRMCRPQYVVRAGGGWSRLVFKSRYELVTEKRADGKPAATAHRLIQFSSGSTGLPKVIGRTEESIAEEIERFARVPGMPQAGERVLLLSSTAHSFGLIAGLLHSLYAGVEVVFAPKLTAVDILGAARDREVNAIFGVPFHYDLLASATEPPALPALRCAVSGGELMPPEVAERFRLTYGVAVGESYGTTETGVIAMDVSGRSRPAVGPAAPGVRLRIAAGELEVAMPESPYLTGGGQERYVDGWLRTRDRAEALDGGVLRLLGRGDSLVVVGGLKVDLTEVEDVLRRHPAISEAVLVHGETIEAYVSTVDDRLAVDDLIVWCRAFLADFKLPKSVWVLPALPRTSNGKLIRERSVLRAAANDDQLRRGAA